MGEFLKLKEVSYKQLFRKETITMARPRKRSYQRKHLTGNGLKVYRLCWDVLNDFPFLFLELLNWIEVNTLERNIVPSMDSSCWIWKGATAPGDYGMFTLSKKQWGFGVIGLSHIASYLAFRGEIPEGKRLHHICKVKSCCNPDHLSTENHHSHAHKTLELRDFASPHLRTWKLTLPVAQQIYDLYRNGSYTIKELAHNHGVSYSAAYCVIKGITWAPVNRW
jgi:hypothetical protein